MMRGRSIAALLVAGVVVIALAFWSAARGPRESTPLTAGAQLLPGLASSINSVAEVRIIKGDGTRTTLRKGPRYWVVVERDYPADSGRIRKLLLDLAQLQTVEDKTRDPAYYAQLGVDDVSSPKASGTRIELVEPKSTRALILGKPSGNKSSYVRVAGNPQSWLASPQVAADADPKRWLDNAVMDVPQARMREVTVQPASGPAYTLSRTSSQQSDFTVSNIPKGRELLGAGSADAGATALTSLTLDDVRKLAAASASGGPTPLATSTAGAIPTRTHAAASASPVPGAQAHPLASPIAAPSSSGPAQATFRTFNGLTVVVAGHQEGDRHLIHIVSAQSASPETRDEAQRLERFTSWEMEVPGYKYDVMFRPLEDLLKKPEPKAAVPSNAASAPAKHKGKHSSASASSAPAPASPEASPTP